jgi:hypothetical protein
MATVRVRPTTGPDRVFEIDERIYQAFPDDYQLVEESSPSGYRPPRTAASDTDEPTRSDSRFNIRPEN